jgi:hypothetical protein
MSPLSSLQDRVGAMYCTSLITIYGASDSSIYPVLSKVADYTLSIKIITTRPAGMLSTRMICREALLCSPEQCQAGQIFPDDRP